LINKAISINYCFKYFMCIRLSTRLYKLRVDSFLSQKVT
jgi:hypothetical protein